MCLLFVPLLVLTNFVYRSFLNVTYWFPGSSSLIIVPSANNIIAVVVVGSVVFPVFIIMSSVTFIMIDYSILINKKTHHM